MTGASKYAFALMLAALAGCSPQRPPSDALLQVRGQVCSGTAGPTRYAYTIGEKNGSWAVREVYGPPGGPMQDGGWIPAEVRGSSLSFKGETAPIVALTATGPQSIHATFGNTSYAGDFNCVAAPPGQARPSWG